MTDAIVLCGGAGLRLRTANPNVPKSMSTIGGRPFLEILLKQLRRYGFERVILAVGYRKEAIRSHFGTRAFDLSLEYSEEDSPLGTAGALRRAADLVESDLSLVMNGDSYVDVDLEGFVKNHQETNAEASLVVVPKDQRADCGFVSVGEHGQVVEFKEKQFSPGRSYLNGGMYLISRILIFEIPPSTKISLEEEMFPKWIKSGKRVRAFPTSGMCVDIGTPDRYLQAQHMLMDVEK